MQSRANREISGGKLRFVLSPKRSTWRLTLEQVKEGGVSEIAYVSKVHIERKAGPLRIANLPGESQPVLFSVHGAIAKHYKVDPSLILESHASTIDYTIAATAG
jgi:hypothetical protein